MIQHDIQTKPQEKDLERLFYLQKANEPNIGNTTAGQRIVKLKKLREAIMKRRNDIHIAMQKDLRKPGLETDITEIKTVVTEINFAIHRLHQWMSRKRVSTPLMLFGTSSYVQFQPKGTVLIISPWNFPVNLSLGPLVGAVAAGNCVILKPSEYTPHASHLIRQIVEEVFDEQEVAVIEGDATVSKSLLQFPFNHIFFTGGTEVGKIIMRAAAEHLSSVTLELGGKSPVIIDESVNMKVAVEKIAWLKFMNFGQICISPDYVLVQESVKDVFIKELTACIEKFYGASITQRQQSPDLCRMVSDNHFFRVKQLTEDAISKGAVVHTGGQYDAADKYIDPTVLSGVNFSMPLMQEEIFGPVLPVHTFKTKEEAAGYINAGSIPLATYVFSQREEFLDYMLHHTKAGDVCINECGYHFYNPHLPFGGMNGSGIGKAHGKHFFEEFSNSKGVLRQHLGRFSPLKILFPPYSPRIQRLFRHVIRWP